jgi:hypothetical protein
MAKEIPLQGIQIIKICQWKNIMNEVNCSWIETIRPTPLFINIVCINTGVGAQDPGSVVLKNKSTMFGISCCWLCLINVQKNSLEWVTREKLCISCSDHGALRSKTENWLALCQDNVSHILDHITWFSLLLHQFLFHRQVFKLLIVFLI